MKRVILSLLFLVSALATGAIEAAGPLVFAQILLNRQTILGGGTISVTISGGTGPYTFQLDANPVSAPQASTSFTFPILQATIGAHTIKVVDTATSETISATEITIEEPVVLQIISIEVVNPTSAVATNGSITITAEGITAAKYQWTLNGTPIATTDCSTNPNCKTFTFSGLTGAVNPGNSVRVGVSPLNAAGVETGPATEAVVGLVINDITNPLRIVEILQSREKTFSVPIGDSGTVTVTVAGGSGFYEYNLESVATSPITTLKTWPFIQVPAGTFNLVVTDTNTNPFVTATATVSIEPASTVQIREMDITNPAGCPGAVGVGSIAVTVDGGAAPYTWLNNNVQAPGSPTQVPQFTYSNLAGAPNPGVVQALQVDSSEGSITNANVPLISPAPIVITVNASTAPLCNGGSDGSAIITVSGGTSPYQTPVVTPSAGVTVTGTNPFNIIGLVNNTQYTISVTDAAGCTQSIPLSVVKTYPLSATASVLQQACTGGISGPIIITAATNIFPIPTFDFTLNGVTQTAASLTAAFAGLPSGTYPFLVSVVGSNPLICAQGNVTVSVSTSISVTAKATNATGSTQGSILVTVAGGAAPFTVTLQPGGQSQTGNGPTFNFTGLSNNTYTVTALDDNNCTATTTVTLPTCTRPVSTNAITNFITKEFCGGC